MHLLIHGYTIIHGAITIINEKNYEVNKKYEYYHSLEKYSICQSQQLGILFTNNS